MPRRDGPYMILTQRSPSSYKIAGLDNPGEPLRVYHTSALTPCNNDKVKPLILLRKRGRPLKVTQTPGSSSGRRRNQRGRMFRSIPTSLWPPPAKKSALCACSETWVHFREENLLNRSAAIMLAGGRTAHSAFKLPLDLVRSDSATCNISKGTGQGHVLKTCNLG
ncbi:uncharacterized protein TNCV_220261 [Trichonephila clavipes]|nr:uncharacterized protein TNCV_220261 [Trichonephila clavipes]